MCTLHVQYVYVHTLCTVYYIIKRTTLVNMMSVGAVRPRRSSARADMQPGLERLTRSDL